MSRHLNQTYRCQPLRQFAQQLRYAPPNRRADQVRRLEQLHDEIDPQATYPLDYLAYRITRYRLEHDDDIFLVGEAVSPDLRLMIDQLSRTLDLPPEQGDTIRTLDQWATRLHVSRKTIERWRKAGLRWRWFITEDSDARQIGIDETAVAKFRAAHPQRVANASTFVHLDDAERQQLIRHAREIKQQSPRLSLRQVAQRLTKISGRSLEAMRLLLEKHDENPARLTPDDPEPLFIDRREPLTERDKQIITRAAQRGVTFQRLSQRFGRTRSTLHRIVQEHRAATALQREIHYVKLPTFNREDADEVLLGATLSEKADGPWPKLEVMDLPPPLQQLYRQRTFTDKRLRSTIIRYNYLKFKADCTRQTFTPYAPRVAQLQAFDDLLAHAHQLRHRMIASHLPTILSVVKQHLIDQPHTAAKLVELLKIGHAVLFDAMEVYDASRTPTFEAHLRSLLRQRLTHEWDEGEARARRRIDDTSALKALIDHARKYDVNLNATVEHKQERGV